MNPAFYKNNPFRPPQWRAERVIALVTSESRPSLPRRYDDRYVRAYRRFLMGYLSAGDDVGQRQAIVLEQPHVYQAHLLRYSPDTQWRQILEARLLTCESFAEIAPRFATDAQTIDCYEQLFFNVRDRMQHSDWITKIILGTPESRATIRSGVMTDDQRGFVYRLFAYHGGPLVLDAMISGVAGLEQPLRVAEVGDWLDRAQRLIIQSRAMMAAKVFEINRTNVMQILKLALRPQLTARVAKPRTPAPQTELDEQKYLEQVMAQFQWDRGKSMHAKFAAPLQTDIPAAADPRADEQLADPAGNGRSGQADRVEARRIRLKKTTTQTTEVTLESLAKSTAGAHNNEIVLPTAPTEPFDALSAAEVSSCTASSLMER